MLPSLRYAFLIPVLAFASCGGSETHTPDGRTTASTSTGSATGSGTGGAAHVTPTCGNGRLDAIEICDGDAFDANATCDFNNLGSGDVKCTAACTLDVSGCQMTDYCEGNGFYGDDQCDACERLGGHADPACAQHCGPDGICANWFDPSVGEWSCAAAGFGNDPDCGTCGDGKAEGHEYCDGQAWREVPGTGVEPSDCTSWSGYVGGKLGCTADCTPDFSACVPE